MTHVEQSNANMSSNDRMSFLIVFQNDTGEFSEVMPFIRFSIHRVTLALIWNRISGALLNLRQIFIF